MDIKEELEEEERIPVIPENQELSGEEEDAIAEFLEALFDKWDRDFFDSMVAAGELSEEQQDIWQELLWKTEKHLMEMLGIHPYHREELKTPFLGSCYV